MANEGIEIEVHPWAASPSERKNTLNGRTAPRNLRELGANGAGSFQIGLRDPKIIADPTLLESRNIVKTRVDGQVTGAFSISGIKAVTISDEEAQGEGYEVSGEGLKAWLDDAEVRPNGALQAASSDTRYFNFATERNHWYKPGDWVDPFIIAEHHHTPPGYGWDARPEEWPENTPSKWIWAQPFTFPPDAPYGNCYFRYEFYTAEENNFVLYCCADDRVDIWLNGALLSASDPNVTALHATIKQEFRLPAGNHVLAFKGSNSPHYGGPAGLLTALFTTHELVETLHSMSGYGSGWKALPYPEKVPGWSVGEIMLKLFAEAQARGIWFPNWLIPTFTAEVDSRGVPWGDPLEWSFDIGESYLSVLGKFEELLCDSWVDPDTYQWHITQQQGVDRTIFKYDVDGVTVLETPVIFQRGKNLRKATSERRGKIKNSLSVKTPEGWLKADESSNTSKNKYGVIEGSISTEASPELSLALANMVFTHKAMEEEGASYEIVVVGDKIPHVHYNEGDWVLAPNEKGEQIPRRIMSISTEESDTGRPLYTIEFDTIFQDNETKLSKAVAKMGGGGVGGGLANTGSNGYGTPTPQPTPSAPPIKIPKYATWPAEFATSTGSWDPGGVSASSTLSLVWNPVTENTDGSPVIPRGYEVWGRLASSPDDAYQLFVLASEAHATIHPFEPGTEWVFRLVTVNENERKSSPSATVSHVMAGPTLPMAAPSAPTLSSSNGLLYVGWDGLLAEGGTPPPQYRYTYAMVSTTIDGTYTQMGAVFFRGTRSISIASLDIGVEYFVKLVVMDGMGIASQPSAATSITVIGIALADLDQATKDLIQEAIDMGQTAIETADGKNTIYVTAVEPFPPEGRLLVQGDQWWVVGTEENADNLVGIKLWNGTNWMPYRIVAEGILVPGSVGNIVIADGAISTPKLQAGSVDANIIGAGVINTSHLTAGLGNELDISANSAVTIIVGQLGDVQADGANTSANLAQMQTYYKFGPQGAEISTPGSPYSLALKNDRIEMLENGQPVSYWSAGQMVVRSLVGEEVVLGNHKLEKYTTGTVVRAL